MRMWNIKPGKLCSQHLLGEHFEIHKAVGNLRHSGKWARSLTEKGFLEPQNMLRRHDLLAREMLTRGMNHKSKLDMKNAKLPKGKVNKEKSIRDLKKRCRKCRERLMKRYKNH